MTRIQVFNVAQFAPIFSWLAFDTAELASSVNYVLHAHVRCQSESDKWGLLGCLGIEDVSTQSGT